jgi:UDP-glucose 4-epimerase
MRVIVTGGAGFIGSHVSDALVAARDEVHVVDDLSSGRRENVPKEAVLHELDIRREALTDLAEMLQPEVIFHLAAQADVGTSVEQPALDADVNVIGTIRVLEAARSAGARIVFTSTGGAIYGDCARAAREGDPRQPLSPYGTSKLAGEEYLATWNRLYGTSHVACRLANVYGPRQQASLEGGVIAIFLQRLRDERDVEIFGDGDQTRDFVYVGDVVRALLAAGSGSSGGVFNVGTGTETSILELYTLCAKAAGVEQRPPRFGPERPGDLSRSVLDASHAADKLGWRPETSLAAGLGRAWESAQAA